MDLNANLNLCIDGLVIFFRILIGFILIAMVCTPTALDVLGKLPNWTGLDFPGHDVLYPE